MIRKEDKHMRALSKEEVVSKYKNDYYKKKQALRCNEADTHLIENTLRIKRRNKNITKGGGVKC